MSLCDPESGMHRFFSHLLPQNIFVSAPSEDQAVIELEAVMDRRCREIGAVIIEPIIRGAGGMRIYEAAYLRCLRELCDRYDCLLICDEIAPASVAPEKCLPASMQKSRPTSFV